MAEGVAESKCGFCHMIYQDEKSYLHHMTTLECMCEICGEVLKNPNKYSSHFISHKQGALYQCSLCIKSFSNLFTLRWHIISHNRDIFSCSLCRSSFPCKKSLMSHVTNEHVLPWNCNTCGHVLRTFKDLKKHKLAKASDVEHEDFYSDEDIIRRRVELALSGTLERIICIKLP